MNSFCFLHDCTQFINMIFAFRRQQKSGERGLLQNGYDEITNLTLVFSPLVLFQQAKTNTPDQLRSLTKLNLELHGSVYHLNPNWATQPPLIFPLALVLEVMIFRRVVLFIILIPPTPRDSFR